MILTDRDLLLNLQKGTFSVYPISPDEDIQPASIDLRLDNVLKTVDGEEIIIPDDGYTLKPQEFILGSTFQSVHIPSTLVGIVNGKSSLGRLGVMIHVTAGYIDPGFIGNITLELFNVSNKPFVLMSGMKICQLILETVSSECFRPYGSNGLNSHYQNSKGVVNSRFEYE